MATILSTDKALSYARKAEKSGDWAVAYDLYKGVLDRFPKNKRARTSLNEMKPKAVQGLLQSAKTAQSESRWSQSEQLMALAYELAPDLPQIGIALASLQLRIGKAPDALKTAERILASEPDHVEAIKIKGKALTEVGRGGDAAELISESGDSVEALVELSSLALAAGDKESAFKHAQKAVDLDPENGEAHWSLARTIRYSDGHPHLDQMQKLLETLAPQSPFRAPLHLALFKAFDEIGNTTLAFQHVGTANEIIRAKVNYNFQSDALRYALSKNLFQAPLSPSPMQEGPRPIFVTGLPRTGTTLTERILAQDPRTRACGELPVVEKTVGRLQNELVSGRKANVTEQDIRELRNDILTGLQSYGGKDHILIDKMPLNFRSIGYICAAIPEARIIHMNRDPMAVAWSHYQHAFAGTANGFVYSFEDIAKFMLLHRDWMKHWRTICPGFILDVDYAALVNETETTTKEIAKFTGLDWNENWLSPERGAGEVRTASVQQVRKPIYGGSDARWKAYETQLEPLRQTLETAGIL